jgi:hypothetical protein
MDRLLHLKHWQLFGLVIGLPFIIEMVVMTYMTVSGSIGMLMILIPLLSIFVMSIFFGWLWAMGVHLHSMLPENVKMNLNTFKIFLIIPSVYIVLLMIFMFGIFSVNPENGEASMEIMPLIVPLHLFSMFCIFYCLYFVSKVLKAVEWQRPVTFSDYVGEFFLIWFFPLGIWFIQPRVNKMFRQQMDN